MKEINTTPDIVNITHYGGDTLTIKVEVSDDLAGGAEWHAQLRSDPLSATSDAEFVITTHMDGATLVLPGSVTRDLVEGVNATAFAAFNANPMPFATSTAVKDYVANWDVQISGPGGIDPIKTLARGVITITLDISRAV